MFMYINITEIAKHTAIDISVIRAFKMIWNYRFYKHIHCLLFYPVINFRFDVDCSLRMVFILDPPFTRDWLNLVEHD